MLFGGAGDDTLDGGSGLNIANWSDASGDVAFTLGADGSGSFSNAATGTDTYSNIAGVMLGAGNDSLTGNAGDNTLMGGDGNDVIIGGDGDDTLDGGAGIDLLDFSVVGAGFTFVLAAGGSGTANLVGQGTDNYTGMEGVIGGAGNDIISGNGDDNTLMGGEGADTLDGKLGADHLFGSAGDDIYYVDNVSDLVAEDEASGGTDLVYSSVTLTLGNYLENLTLTGTAAINGTGNTLANLLTGNSAANVLDGGTGADNLFGGAGNDIYYVDNAYDVTTETSSTGGIDLVYSSVTRTLGNYFENLTLTGTAAIDGTGNTLANKLTGNAAANKLSGGTGNDTLSAGSGNDVLTGGAGRDVMTGGSGNDLFDFNAVSEIGNSLSVCDVIADFQHGYDDIDLSTIDASTKLSGNNAFVWRGTASAFGTSTAGELRYRQFNNAGTANDYTVVYGDTDGDTAAEFQIKLTGLVTLSSSDFKL